MEDRLESIEKKQDQILLILTGNGKPEEGLSFRVAQHAEFVGFWKRFGWVVLGALAGIPPTIMAAIIINMIHAK